MALRAHAAPRLRVVVVMGGVCVWQRRWLRILRRLPRAWHVAWGGGTVWYARRRGRWPSRLSGRVLTRLLGNNAAVPRGTFAPTCWQARVSGVSTPVDTPADSSATPRLTIARSSPGNRHGSRSSRAFSNRFERPRAGSNARGGSIGGSMEDHSTTGRARAKMRTSAFVRKQSRAATVLNSW